MIDHKSQADSNETPEDVATLYSWANLHGAKYRDFSSSRAQAREESRLRVEAAQEAERVRLEEEAERRRQEEAQLAARLAAEAAEAARQAEAERLAEIARQAEAERQAVLAAQEAQRQAALQRTWQPPPPEAYQGDYAPSFSIEADPYAIPLPQFIENAGPEPEVFAEPSRFAPMQPEQFPSTQQFPQALSSSGPLPGLTSERDPDRLPDRLPNHPIDRHRQMSPAQSYSAGSQWAASQPPQSSQQVPSQYPPQQSRPHPTARWAPPSEVLPAHDSRYGSHAPNPIVYDAFSDHNYPASEYAESSYAPQSQEQPTSFRPAWLAAEPPAPTPILQQGRPSAFPSTGAAVPAQRYSGGHPQETSTSLNSRQAPSYPPGQHAGPPVSSNSRLSDSINLTNTPGMRSVALASSEAMQSPNLPADQQGSRWYALKSVFDPNAEPAEQLQQTPAPRAPVLAIFSLAGGVGKTSLVASLSRALSAYGEKVLLVDTAAYGLLPFFFGARDQRPGQLRTFNPPGVSVEAPIQLVTLDPEGQAPDAQAIAQQESNQAPNQDWLAQQVSRYARGVNRVVIDLPTASGSTTRRVLRLSPVVLVPVLPDMNSVVSVGAIEAFFHNNGQVNGKQIMPYYVLNQFDYTLPLHLDVREILREQLGERLLGFAVRRSSVVSEALAEGMTVMDYAPGATVAEDYSNLAGWVRSLSAPIAQKNRGVRWSER